MKFQHRIPLRSTTPDPCSPRHWNTGHRGKAVRTWWDFGQELMTSENMQSQYRPKQTTNSQSSAKQMFALNNYTTNVAQNTAHKKIIVWATKRPRLEETSKQQLSKTNWSTWGRRRSTSGIRRLRLERQNSNIIALWTSTSIFPEHNKDNQSDFLITLRIHTVQACSTKKLTSGEKLFLFHHDLLKTRTIKK